MIKYEYQVSAKATRSVSSFYYNVALRWKNTYTIEDAERYIDNTLHRIYEIGKMTNPRIPTISRWREHGYTMVLIGKWYFAYYIEGSTIFVEDACHEQNMHE